ncbi:SDR family NAD(P)-dependent oxidoreductase [Phytohabitans aurantiacus]|uniref:Oxidoreductase n=1 Tax=Phytohabitans aurantiacus TaxID=3016789 RepID=A0ABQ5R1G5_9ACTN|nr:SDR family oxidoreductase [Phytohabitans aurantiacus]GLI00634.1 oxidoreductase [Phytohabitans aurantiacus]
MDLGLRGNPVLITGGSRGLGRATAETLAAQGCPLAICAREERPLLDLAESLRASHGIEAFVRSVDVTDHERLAEFVAEAADSLGGLRGVVANAGGNRGRGLLESQSVDWTATFDLNVGHAATVTRAAVPYLADGGGGSVVFVASISGWKPSPPAQYAAAKAALVHMATCLSRELAEHGVRVNAVSPGSMLVPGGGWDRMRRNDPDRFGQFLREFPAGRLVDPAEVAEVIAFLLSHGSRGVNGAHIPVDGAQNAPSARGY